MTITQRIASWLLWPTIAPLTWMVRLAIRRSRRPQIWFEFFSELFSLVPFDFGILVRRMFYERTLVRCGENLMVFFGAMFVNPGTTVGDRVEVRPYSLVGLADIGDDVSLAQRVSLLSGPRQHSGFTGTGGQARTQAERIRIGTGAWIGAHAVVMADVGEGSVVGAGAVVVHPIPAHALAVGVPARVVRQSVDEEQGDEG